MAPEILKNGPFSLVKQQGNWVIYGTDGVPIVSLTGQLIDGSGRNEKYPDGIIRTREQREEEAKFVHAAMQSLWALSTVKGVK